MAELVHLRLEHGLTELEEMERVGLFNRTEIRKITTKRKSLEYRLRRRKKKKEDFLQYIDFEICLLLLISKRRERLLCDSKKKEIDNSIAKKINRLFKAVVSRYPEDEKLWLNQIEYLKRMKWNDSINALYTKLLQVHSKSPELWIMAAKWEMDDNNSFDNARKILQRGLLMNPKSEIIWREYFHMELKYIELIKKRREVLKIHNMKDDSEENDAVLKGDIVNIVYDKAVEEIQDIEFALSFIQICLQFDFASENIDYIINDVQEKFPDKEETKDALAKKPLLYVQEKIEEGKIKGIKKSIVLQTIYKEIYSKYDEAVKMLPTEKMWNFYLEFMFSLLQSAKEKKKVKLQTIVMKKMEKAAEANCLPLEYYIHWIDMLFQNGQEGDATLISLTAARKWNIVSLWLKCLTLHIQCRKSKNAIYLLLLEALSAVKEKESLSVWKLGVEWLSICDPEKLLDFFEKGMNRDKDVSLPLKEMYLEAMALRKGVEEARDLYKKFKKMGPLSLQLIKKIITIENGQLKPSIKLMRSYNEDAVKEFGSCNIDVWLDYLNFETIFGSSNPNICSMIHWRAMKTLQPELVKDFQTQITQHCTGGKFSASALTD